MCVGSENNLRYYSSVTDHLCLETWSPRGLELTHKVGWVSKPVSSASPELGLQACSTMLSLCYLGCKKGLPRACKASTLLTELIFSNLVKNL